jgi:single-stranded-DNA-specific exonuclease
VERRWELLSPPEEQIEALASDLTVSPLLARLLINRGISEPEKAWAFLNPQLSDLHDPYLMKGMEQTVSRLLQAIERGERILVYGDYDVDGITSTVLLKRALEMLGGEVGYHIPHRLEDGYGFKADVISDAHDEGYGVIISADSGIREFKICAQAKELGLDLIVTDHHLPDQKLPPAYSILNPRQNSCEYPEKNLAAVGVVLKLVQAMYEKVGRVKAIPHFLKIAAIGTVADLVPLTGENRIIVKHGLSALAEPYNLGLQTLLKGAGVGREVDHIDIGFKLAPRINAFTRMGGGKEVIDLFSAEDPASAQAIVSEMNQKNVQRRSEEDRILAEINSRFKENPEGFAASFLVVAGDEWHRGVIGNVAARLVEKFYRPVLVVSISDGRAQGSGRGIPGFHMLRALDHCDDFFSHYGGHAQAVGCSLKGEGSFAAAVEELSRCLTSYAEASLSPEDLVPRLNIDASLPVDTLSIEFFDEIDQLAPFGHGNPVPVFSSENVRVSDGPWILKEKHLKVRVQSRESSLDAIWWRKAGAAERFQDGRKIDLVYTLSKDNYLGRNKILLTVKDIRSSDLAL